MATTIKKKRRKRRTVKSSAASENKTNGFFEVRKDVKLEGVGTAYYSQRTQKIVKGLSELPNDGETSLFFPAKTFGKAQTASGAINYCKQIVRKQFKALKNFDIKIANYKDVEGKYTHTRVWRTS